MNDRVIHEIINEAAPVIAGRPVGRIYQLARFALAFDFRTGDGRYLFIAVEPNQPRIYMIARTLREMEKGSPAMPSPFVLTLRKQLGGAVLRSLTKDAGERIVRLRFAVPDDFGAAREAVLVAQLTGRSANLFLLDDAGQIIDALRRTTIPGQISGDVHAPPPGAPTVERAQSDPPFARGAQASLSEAADAYYRRLAAERAFAARSAAHMARLQQALTKLRKLQRNLESDLAAHGDAEEHRRIGELLLANIATAERHGNIVRLKDYYAEDAPSIEIEVDENWTLQEEAARRFARYAKAKRAAGEITARLAEVSGELSALAARQDALAKIIEARDEDALEAFIESDGERAAGRGGAPSPPPPAAQNREESVPGARRYRSTDGYEILVGRGARDNDHLTFRVARSYDLWLHASDYPGSHVIVRNHQRKEDVPQRTVIEAAQLAAHFSQARKDSKVAVNYTPRKFLSKPKGAAPGLVRMSSFRTMIVEPRETLARI